MHLSPPGTQGYCSLRKSYRASTQNEPVDSVRRTPPPPRFRTQGLAAALGRRGRSPPRTQIAEGRYGLAATRPLSAAKPGHIEAVRRILPLGMHRLAAVIAVGMLVASCAGTAKERMAKFDGLPLSAAIAKIGDPIDERWVAGKKVYIWGSLVDPAKPAKDKTVPNPGGHERGRN